VSGTDAEPAVSTPDVHAFVQVQHLTVVRDIAPKPAEAGFILRRARVWAEGNVYSPRFGYRAAVEAVGGAVVPLDLYGELRPTPRWSLKAGQLRVPFSRNFLISEERLAFAERSIATEEFRYGYDVGILATASFVDDRLFASFGVLNGAGGNTFRNDNVDPLFIARVTGTIGARASNEEGDLAHTRPPSLTLGAAATLDYVPAPTAYGFSSGEPAGATPIVERDTNGNGRPDGVRVLELEGDLSFRWRGLAVDAEAYFRHESWDQIGALQPPEGEFVPHARYGGAFAQATYFVPIAHLQAGARVAVTELSPLTLGGRQRPATLCEDLAGMAYPCALPFTERRSELTIVAVGHWFGHGIQVVGMYSALRWDTARSELLPWSREQRFLVQTQLAF
jgi:hypothetical protein